METANHERYVSLEVAKLLKEAGFDWEIREYYKFTDEVYRFSWNALPVNWNKKVAVLIAEKHGLSEGHSAPTLDVAQRWLREVKNYHICISFLFANNHKYYAFVSRPSDRGHLECECGWIENKFDTYEEAQEAGIKKALELILK